VSQPAQKTKIIAGDEAVLARRYARALVELADEQKQIDAVTADLGMLQHMVAGSPEFNAIANHPRLSETQLLSATKKVAAAAKLGALSANFIGLLAKNRRLSLLNSVADIFLDQIAERRGEFTADVTTARPLSPTQQDALTAKLSAWTGGKVHLAIQNDPSLLGGIVVKMGSKLIDASLKTKLARLERALKSEQNMTQHQGAA
jgi:F-type H+-transporting ATPase subunit delta